jgi:glycosyltransferase involved in cell wall biosynthesis
MKKVVFLLYNLDPGGIETKLLRFLIHSGKHLDATVILKSGRMGLLESDFKSIGTNLLPIKCGYLNIRSWFTIYRIFKAGHFITCCDYTGNFAGVYLFLAKMAGIGNRIAYYGQASNHFKEAKLNLIYNHWVNKLVSSYSTKIISNSKAAFDFFFGNNWVGNPRYEIMNNGIEVKRFLGERDTSIRKELGIANTAKVIVYPARYDVKKNHEAALNVATWFKTKELDVYLIFCGKGTENLKSKIVEYQVGKRVFALGYREDVNLILRNSDVCYFPSYTEGQPNALIEAIVSGLPFVASNITAIREVIPGAYHEFLVEPDDYQKAAKKIHEIFNGDYRSNFSFIQQWAMKNFDSEHRFQEFYEVL